MEGRQNFQQPSYFIDSGMSAFCYNSRWMILENGEEVKISGFGNFSLRDKKARVGRNPKTGEEKMISARRVVTFKTGQKLKARVEVYNGKSI